MADESPVYVPVPEAGAAKTATQTELELVALEARRQELLAKKAVEDQLKASVSRATREVAIQLHAALCPHEHPRFCGFFEAANATDPDRADWTAEQHQRWLAIASVGISVQRSLRWTVTEPE